jgi:hypothetical protein
MVTNGSLPTTQPNQSQLHKAVAPLRFTFSKILKVRVLLCVRLTSVKVIVAIPKFIFILV